MGRQPSGARASGRRNSPLGERQAQWEIVPGTRVLGIDAPQATVTRALNMLTRLEVLVREGDDYFVAIGQ
jgi:hypothetical protein